MNSDLNSVGSITLGWWSKYLGNREHASAKALAARLRRSAPITALAEPAVHSLAQDLNVGPHQADQLMRLASLLAEIRDHDSKPLARCLGHADPITSRLTMSHLRFQRLLRADGDELTTLLRRAIKLAGRRCNVARLAKDLFSWEQARPRWCFDYFSSSQPNDTNTETEQ